MVDHLDICCSGRGGKESDLYTWPMGLKVEVEQGLFIFKVEERAGEGKVGVKDASENICCPQGGYVCLESIGQGAQGGGPQVLNREDPEFCHDRFRADVLVSGGLESEIGLCLNLHSVSPR